MSHPDLAGTTRMDRGPTRSMIKNSLIAPLCVMGHNRQTVGHLIRDYPSGYTRRWGRLIKMDTPGWYSNREGGNMRNLQR